MSTPMPPGARLDAPPPGFVSFCMRFKDQCASAASEPDILPLNSPTWSELTAINARVNDAIWPEDDKLKYGRAEFWTIPTDGYGDCEDYALTKRKLLAEAGLPRRALRIAIVITRRNNRHAVLTIATDKGDFVLDNQTDNILPWKDTGYTWISRQDARDDWGWVALGGPRPYLVAGTASSPAAAR